MHHRTWTVGLLLALGLVLSGAGAVRTAEKASSEQIDHLIQQLGSSEFAEREKATAALEKIGAAALEPLQKAVQGEDAEVSRRARSLVARIERRAASERLLEPKRVHLVYKDTPLSKALEDFQKQSGYTLYLIDPEQKLKDRTLTLDTGETSFWHALALFRDKAGLVEGTRQDLFQMRPGMPAPLPPPGLPQPGVIRNPQAAPPVPPPLAPPAPPRKDLNKDKLEKGRDVQDRPVPPAREEAPVPPPPPAPPQQPGGGIRLQVQFQVQGQPVAAPQVQIMPAVPGGMGGMGMGGPLQNRFTLYLKDGKPRAEPCDDRSSVRIRIVDGAPGQRGEKPAPGDVIALRLEAQAEPRLQLTSLGQVRIQKAIDDQGQDLHTAQEAAQGGPPIPGAPGVIRPGIVVAPMMPVGGFGMMGMQAFAQVRLQRGEKPAKTLARLEGTVTASLIVDDHPSVTVNDILKAADKTFKGENGAFIKVLDVKDKEDQLTLQLEMQHPNQAPMGGFMPVPVVPQPQIAPPPPPPGAVRGGPVAAMPRPAAGPMFREGFMGLTLRDDRGKSLPFNVVVQTRWAGGPNGPTVSYEITCKRKEGQAKPSKLVMATRAAVQVDVPFTVKDVPLP